MAKYQCANCSHTAAESDLPDAKDIFKRLDPGGMYTDKECPECGALCFPVENELKTTETDHEEVLADHRRLVRELDVLINGEEGAAAQASLVDIVSQVRKQGLTIKQASAPTVTAFSPDDLLAILEAARVALKDERMSVKIADSMDESDRRITELRDKLEAAMQSDVPLFSPGVQHALDLFLVAYDKWNSRAAGGEDDLHYAAKYAREQAAAPVTVSAPHKLMGPFVFRAPGWANSGRPPANPADALQRAREMSSAYYALGAQCGIHSMIEWCGVMGEYCRMLEAAQAAGIDPCEVDQHHADCKVAIPEFMATYFVEKLGCQLKPFIRSDRSMWRRLLEDWFEGEGQHIVCELIAQKPAVSLHATEEDAMKHAVACAMENLYTPEDPEDPEDRKESQERLYDMLTELDSICEGDYEVHMLLPTNRQR